ncbi:homeobox-leucine zipper protein ROC2-like isoform X1 [Zingiber officinale]|uniref:homeobox-leucine zipper protein ROC2-like isoform X1 n=1 Tax=Zingiber officinale TaxID=94328 RepID=UPI001C4B08DE|nr:homeobox-leucine zipper protein ROC2-like isoform X1 [Zingiber officinale]XP_042403663.1 homeobox-leucine zipper protein ROC2-like isoform X1 [Zingiber officinale]
MPVGIMIPARQQSAASMMGRNTGTSFGSSSVLSLSQPNLLEGGQQIPLQYQHGSNHQLLEMAAVTTAESEMARAAREDVDFESKSAGSENIEGASGDDQDQNQRPRKKRYHRHTQHQIQEMESFFKECPHPDDKQRKELSRELGLEPLQIKFWFQNKRTQMKNQHERHENSELRAENEKLRAENMRYKEALSNAACPNCGGPASLGEMSLDEHHLRIENARLREEIDRISGIAAKYVGKPMAATGPSYPLLSPTSSRSPLDLGFGAGGGGGSEEVYGGDLLRGVAGQGEMEKPVVVELAVAAMEELIRMAQLNEPLWVPHEDTINSAGVGASGETLNEDEYMRAFPRGFGPKQFGLKTEASRETAVVIMNQMNVVEMLMDVVINQSTTQLLIHYSYEISIDFCEYINLEQNQWSNVFPGIVSRAFTLEVLSTGVAGNYNGALQLMSAEFQVPSPLVPTREFLFVRYCKQHPDGTWAVVDVSLDSLRPGPVLRCRRRPSGCLIQEMPNGYSKVTWVEHVEVDDRSVHNIYKPLVNSGLAFGAKRWVCTLDRQCERLASVMASNIPSADIGVITSAEGRKSMLKLAERMVMSFCGGVSASTTHQWTTLSGSGAEDVRVMTRKSVDDPGRPPGIVLNAATSFWLPVSPKRVFDFLRDETTRSEWDILSNGGVVQEMAHIANGQDQGNCVSLLRVNSTNSNQSNMLILQESCTDATGSYVIYAPVDVMAMNVVLNGGDPDYVALLPSGFAILPDGPSSASQAVSAGGSLLTVAFQILVDSVPTAKLSLGSVATVNSLIACTVERIKASVAGETIPH